jgi:prephenate dehydrogenase
VSAAGRKRGQTVAIIGTGLIGTSIGLALRRATADTVSIAGWDSRKSNLAGAQVRGGITRRSRSLEDALTNAQFVVLACPIEVIEALLPQTVASAQRGALIIEVGSVKAPVSTIARQALRSRPDVQFVGGHPMAGSERSGPANADPELFAGRPFALVAPPQRGRARALARADTFVRRLGGLPVRMSAREHDRLVAAVSGLPQLASLALALAVDSAAGARAKVLAGPGYRDATRLAASPFSIWKSALNENRVAVRDALRCLDEVLATLSVALARGDEAALSRLFSRAAAARRRVVAN